jgi:hypothetical protein
LASKTGDTDSYYPVSWRWWVHDANSDNAVAAHPCSRFRALLDDNAHDGSRVLGEPDRRHSKIAVQEGVASLVNRKLSQIRHNAPRASCGTGRNEPLGDPLNKRLERAVKSIDQRIGVRVVLLTV